MLRRAWDGRQLLGRQQVNEPVVLNLQSLADLALDGCLELGTIGYEGVKLPEFATGVEVICDPDVGHEVGIQFAS